MKLVALFSTLMVAGLFLVAGCGDSGTTGGSGGGSNEKPKKVVIGFVAKSNTNPVFQAAHVGARDAAKELAAKYGVEIEVNIQTPTGENAQKQAEAVENLSRLGAAGIAVACSDANALTPAIDRAVGAGVAVICFDSDAPKSKRFAYYGTDDIDCGKQVMAQLAKEMGGKGTIAILAGNQSAPNLANRVAGVREELKNHPDIKEIASGAVYHEETPEKAAEKVQEVQRANGNITGWAMIGGWPLFTRDALPWAPGAVKVVSVDALPQQIGYLESGHVQVLLAQDCYGWGYKSVEILMEKIVNKKDPASVKVIDPLTKVTKDNAAEWSKKWEKWVK